MKILAITQARMSSSRLPQKVLRQYNGITFLERHLLRLKKIRNIDNIVVAIAEEEGHEKIVEIVKKLNLQFVAGDVKNVLNRFVKAASVYPADYVCRFTSDCPLLDSELTSKFIDQFLKQNAEYGSLKGYPDGMDSEIFRFDKLIEAHHKATIDTDLEHVTPYIIRNSNIFYQFSPIDNSHIRVTLDNIDDEVAIKNVLEKLGDYPSCDEIVSYYNSLSK